MTNPEWWGKEKSVKQKANESEDVVYKHLCSGSLSQKGDFSNCDTVFDNKSTKYKSISVTEVMCEKLLSDALQMGKENAVLILDLPNYYGVCKIVKKSLL